MIEEMKLRNFSPATQKSYLYAVTRLTQYYRKAPDQLDKEQIRSSNGSANSRRISREPSR
jgi:integrase/recombinase XerD